MLRNTNRRVKFAVIAALAFIIMMIAACDAPTNYYAPPKSSISVPVAA